MRENNYSEITLKELIEMDPAIKKAAIKLAHLMNDEETMSIYYAREKSLHDQANMVNSAEQRGREAGREEGKQEGRRERNIEVAQKLLLTGMDIEMIGSITELSIEEIQDLKSMI